MEKLVHDDLRTYVTSRLFYSLGVQLTAVFIPLLLMRHGLVLWQVWGYYVGMAVTGLSLIRWCVQVIQRRGVKAGYVIGYSALAGYFGLLALFTEGVSWVLPLLPVAWSLSCVFTMCCVTLYVGKTMDVARKGRDCASIELAIRGAAVVGPCAGTVIATFFGSLWLNLSAVMFMIASLIILLGARNMEPPQPSAPPVRYVNRPPLRDLLAIVGFDITTDVASIIWPTYLAVIAPDFQGVGWVVTVAAIFVLPVVARAGWLIDNGRYKRTMLTAVVSVAGIHLLRFLSVNPYWLTAMTALFSMALAVLTVAWNSSYRHSVRQYGLTYLLWTQTAIWLSCTVVFSVLAVLTWLGPDWPLLSFIVACLLNGGLVWGCQRMRRV